MYSGSEYIFECILYSSLEYVCLICGATLLTAIYLLNINRILVYILIFIKYFILFWNIGSEIWST